MDSQSEQLLRDSVWRILEHADLNIMNNKNGLDSNLPGYENVVKNVIHNFFCKNAQVTPWLDMPITLKQEDAGTSQEAEISTCIYAWMLLWSTVEIDQLQNSYAGIGFILIVLLQLLRPRGNAVFQLSAYREGALIWC
ncbi:hypothetical protein MPTK1_Vg00140 [Marchantia polymorpha subsp. ruderalis]|uniref:Uncharacterized protein n=1 Tax=Marchantia polymorpha TaxID=3197 RepID=A0A2R6VWW8_MARPO|nr:hypothetical protein MARPO_YB0036 [Marchantia polymorpha]BBN20458.1 hypothetical protein Mp_Vg00140 [Marchantia polymorpha subsp. ruderalis]|eukprot:PTQ26095.1 hypothetical protein MARPO_YB0036 [Marchantia polymorpha]